MKASFAALSPLFAGKPAWSAALLPWGALTAGYGVDQQMQDLANTDPHWELEFLDNNQSQSRTKPGSANGWRHVLGEKLGQFGPPKEWDELASFQS